MLLQRLVAPAIVAMVIVLGVAERQAQHYSARPRPTEWLALPSRQLDPGLGCLETASAGAFTLKTAAHHCFGTSEGEISLRWSGDRGELRFSSKNGPDSWELIEVPLTTAEARSMALAAASLASVPPTTYLPDDMGRRVVNLHLTCGDSPEVTRRFVSTTNANVSSDEMIRAVGQRHESLDDSVVLSRSSPTVDLLGLAGSVVLSNDGLAHLPNTRAVFHPAEGLFRWRWDVLRRHGLE